MFVYTSTETFESKSCPGVRYTLKKMSAGRRIQLDLKLAQFNANLRELHIREQQALQESDQITRVGKLMQIEAETGTLVITVRNPVLLDWGLERLEGLMIEGDPADLIDLIEKGPEELHAEIIDRILEVAGLKAAMIENLSLPTTSGAPVDGQIPPTSAPAASAPDNTGDATAASSTPTATTTS